MSMIEVDPNEFIITKKRKLYKFALFANSPLCFELDEWRQGVVLDMSLKGTKSETRGVVSSSTTPKVVPRKGISKTTPVVVEVGAGTGLFSVELASLYPQRQFIAVDVKADRLQKGAYEAQKRALKNIYFVRARADQLAEVTPLGSIESSWLTFPDPFPKARAARRRLTHAHFLQQYGKLLTSDGSLYLKHDNRDFFMWSLEQLVATKWRIKELSFDLHNSDLSSDYKIETTYETRWLKEGLVTNFVKASCVKDFAKIK